MNWIVSHHMNVVLSNSSETARTSVPVSSPRSGYVTMHIDVKDIADDCHSWVHLAVLRRRSTNSKASLLSRGELVTSKRLMFILIPRIASRMNGMGLYENGLYKHPGCSASRQDSKQYYNEILGIMNTSRRVWPSIPCNLFVL